MRIFKSPRGQAMPGPTRPMSGADFAPRPDTAVTWLGSAGIFLNSRGTTLMVDPLLQDFDMPLLIQPPILPRQVPQLDALLIIVVRALFGGRLRVTDAEEALGLDVAAHGESAYPAYTGLDV